MRLRVGWKIPSPDRRIPSRWSTHRSQARLHWNCPRPATRDCNSQVSRAAATKSYGLRVFKVLARPPATSVSCNPASLAAGSSNANVLVTGVSTNGSGFFDPGSGFSNRLAAAFNGAGITIRSVTYSDPTHVTLNISISAGAAAGPRTFTITNPDGQ